jgi:CRP/FNR family transcriptional regulator
MPVTQEHIEKFNKMFEPEVVQRLVSRVTAKTVGKGKILVEIRDHIIHVPLLLEGRIKVERRDGKGNGVFLHYIQPYEICPISFYYGFSKEKSDIRCIADTEITYLAIPVERAASWFDKFSTWRSYLAQLTQRQHAKLLSSFDDIFFHNLDYRLKRYLKEKIGLEQGEEIFVKHQDIALDLQVSRETISRALKKMENMDMLQLGRGKIKIINLD